jgi:LemA protein
MISGFIFILAVLSGFLALGTVGWLVSVFNSLIQVKNNIGKAWKNIDVLLLQRNEELPKLIDLCKAYMKYEEDVLRSLTTLRLAYGNAGSVVAKTNIENQVAERMAALTGVGERHPELKANELFRNLQGRIADLEASIADRRVFFNDTVAIYNIQIEQVPQMYLAWFLRYKPHPYLKLPGNGNRRI